MKRLIGIPVLCLLATLGASVNAHAADSAVNYWITRQGQTNAITSINVGLNEEFTLSVWYSTDLTNTNVVSTFLGYDTSAKFGNTPTAAPIDNKITMTSANGFNIASSWNGNITNKVAGSMPTTGSAHYYGLTTNFNTLSGEYVTATAGTRLYDVTLKNIGVGTGQSYVVKLWDNPGTSASYDTYLAGKTASLASKTLSPGNGAQWTYDLNVTNTAPVPEPSALMAFGSGILGLAGYVIRRKK